MITHGTNIMLIAGNASKKLTQQISEILKAPICDAVATRFSDGEIAISIKETVRGKDVFIIESLSHPVNDCIMELLIFIDALKRASAGRITAVIPYLGYARQDRKARARDPISAKVVADIITVAGADRVLTMDLHAAQIQGFFTIPVDHLYGQPVLAKTIHHELPDNLVVVSPDVGSVTRAREMANRLDAPLAIIDKRRPRANVCEVMNIIGDVSGKNCLLVDDLIDTAGTITEGAKALVKFNCKDVYACCTHGVLSGPAIQRIEESPIKKLWILDTIEIPQEKLIDKIELVSIAPIFAQAIEKIYKDEAISVLYE